MSIIVGFIPTREGHAAIDFSVAEARRRDARLIIINSKQGGGHEPDEEFAKTRDAIEELEARLDDERVGYEVHEYVRGNTPAEDIMQAVADHDGDLIVIGIRTRTKTGKYLLGSNALDILHDATVPVVCVKAE